jgi:rhodanese-related sulfurtransferase
MNAHIAEIEEVLARAAERGQIKGLKYAGEIMPVEAHRLAGEAGAKIIDVRTPVEYASIGHIPGTPLVEWKRLPSGEASAEFLDPLLKQYARDDMLLFLCRSGVRSHWAAEAATRAGFMCAYNILEGFEGDADASGQRGNLGGWRKAGLPWEK